ncbi:MAG: hypothetical protein Q4F37_05330 [Corynebacterium sp.]|uniref:hypothetical protein n=1 Tax=Corynebacterium sp. TaxID=1720 RepID=UPI0026F64951|nr:hypothetical protein [Corynebacterium sp.]
MSSPKPRDPHRPQITPADVDAELSGVLATPAADLAAETAQLEAAHDVLHRALQKN